MAQRPSRYRTADPDLDARLDALLDVVGATEDRDQLFEMLVSVVRMAGDDTDRLDLKIANAALKEMRAAFRMFAPYAGVPKVTVFGSARTQPDDPLYEQARNLSAALAAQGWMVVTGAGPGIMAAGMEGAGRDKSFGVRIRLPFEPGANAVIAGDVKLVTMKYFFTRKLMLIKESAAFVCLPGGFGTLDETFELLTLAQTGKSEPAPIVLLDVPNGTYWSHWSRFVVNELVERGLIASDDLELWKVTDDPDEAVREVVGFYANYQSMRYVGDRLVIRLRHPPTEAQVGELNRHFGSLCASGTIEASPPLPPEVADGDALDLARLAFRFDRRQYGGLRALIDALNRLVPAPALTPSRPAPAGSPPPSPPPDAPA